VTLIGVFALLVIAYGLVSGRLEGTSITAPMVFVAAGLIAAATGKVDAVVATPGVGDGAKASIAFAGEPLLVTAEIALALVLFTDAARLHSRSVRQNTQLPARLLLLGLPLTIALGGVVAFLVFHDELVIWEALLLAAIVAPTDAALGEAVVTSPKLPVRIRQALNVESGLNDGLAVPLFTIFLALAVAEEEVTAASAGRVVLEKIGWGVVVGMVVGVVGGGLVRLSAERGWLTGLFGQLTVASLGVFGWWAAEEIGGSGFIAAFVGGLVTGRVVREIGATIVDFTEDVGQLLNLFVFFVFGLAAYELLDLVTWKHVVFAVLALTVVRILPVAIVLLGTGVGRPTVWFVGWFGPRGLASIILAFITISDEPRLEGLDTVVLAMTVTVLLSVVAHGVTAAPLVERYAAWCAAMGATSPEMELVPELPTRLSRSGSATAPGAGNEP
jgi:NhaP-type Na+/H+ or K+/H+ antiporter